MIVPKRPRKPRRAAPPPPETRFTTIERLTVPETRAERLRGRWLSFEAVCTKAAERGSKSLRFDVANQCSVLHDGGTISGLDVQEYVHNVP